MSTEYALVGQLEEAHRDLERAETRVEEIGEDRLRDLQEAHEELTGLLGRYEERATGSGDFMAYIDFQEAIEAFVKDLPEDLPEREVFEDIDERMQKRRLTEGDFEAARSELSPIRDLLDRLDERSEARNRLRSARNQIREEIHELRQEIDRLETVRRLGRADLEAPVEELAEPIDTYNESVRSAFETYKHDAPAREVLGLVRTAEQYPLLDFDRPPAELSDYLQDAPVGTETLPTLLEYTDHSRSKLSHYVEDPATFLRVVGGNRTYLDRLDAEPLTVEWPPPSAAELRWRADELISMLNRFAPADTICALQSVLEVARDEEIYSRLRQTARARAELTEAERERIRSGAVEEDLQAANQRLETLEDTLDR